MLLYFAVRFSPKFPLHNTLKIFFYCLTVSCIHMMNLVVLSPIPFSGPPLSLLHFSAMPPSLCMSWFCADPLRLSTTSCQSSGWRLFTGAGRTQQQLTPWKKVTALPQQPLIFKHPSQEVGSHGVK